MDKQQEVNVPLGTYISQAHRDKLDRMKDAGLKISSVVELGIDAVYAQMVGAGVIEQRESVALKEAA
jgi:hypothetical protein